MKQLLFFLLVMFGTQAFSQQSYSTQTNLSPGEYGAFNNFVFFLNGKTIKQQELTNYPGAKLNTIRLYTHRERQYDGVLYLNTSIYPTPSIVQYINDLACFINGKQVSPYNIGMTKAEEYTRIHKIDRDTMIDGRLYKKTIYVDTDEDFFAERLSLSELIKKYTRLPLDRVIVHWRSNDVDHTNHGTIIHDHFSTHYINSKKLETIDVDTIRFAEGKRYVIHLIDSSYRSDDLIGNKGSWSRKTQAIFRDLSAINTGCPCYLADLDITGRTIHHRAQLESEPYQGKKFYLKKLSTTMNLPPKKSTKINESDSISVQFIVTERGMITRLESTSPVKSEHRDILEAIKKYSCPWSPPRNNAGPFLYFLLFKRQMTILYSKDKNGNIQSLDNLEYRYDDGIRR